MVRQSDITHWRKFFSNVGLDPSLAQSYLGYAEKLIQNGVPVIFDLGHLAAHLGRTEKYIASTINSTSNHYRTFEIPKRKGGTRQITAPYPALLECQQWINSKILSRIDLHPAVNGFVRRKSIVTNAALHVAHAELLKIDIKDFFPSIPIARIIAVFRQLGYAPNIAFFLARLCCVHDSLPQGASTSPQLSNIVFFKSDVRLDALAKRFGLTYSRYADDLIFSGEHVPRGLTRYAKAILQDEGFKINRDKTRYCRTGDRKIVTGILLSEGRLRVPVSFRREVTRDVYYIKKFGYLSHATKKKIRDPYYLDRLMGRLNFWKQVEKDNGSVKKMILTIEHVIKGFRETN